MSQYMLLLHENPAELAGLGPDEVRAVISEYVSWGENLAASGKLLGNQKLKDEGGRHLVANGKQILVTDGPFAEAKEVLGGYFLVEARSYDEAVEIAKTCPHLKYHGRIELREVDELH
jgi:hypothetical protein